MADNDGMDLMMQFGGVALASTLILRMALAERARLAARMVPVPVRAEEDYAVRR